MAVYSFDDLIESIANAVIHAQRIAEKQHMVVLSEFFDLEEQTGRLRAKTVQISVPSLSADGEEHEPIEVPLCTLVPLSSLKLADVSIEFQANITGLGEQAAPSEERGAPMAADKKKTIHLGLKGGGALGRKANEVTVKITMTATDPPEGIVRVNDRIMKQLP